MNLQSRVQAFQQAFNTHDARALAALFTDDAEFVNVLGMWWRGRAAIEAAHAKNFETILAKATLEIHSVETKQLTDDVALCMVRWRRGVTDGPSEGTLEPQTGVLTFVARRRGDDWPFAAAHNTAAA